MNGINTLSENDVNRIIASQEARIRRLFDLLQGVPIGTARIANLAVTNAKITSLSADKIQAGTFLVQIGVGEDADGGILIDGENVRLTMFDATDTRLINGNDGT